MIEVNPIVNWVSDNPRHILVCSYLSENDTLVEAQTNTMERVIKIIPKLKKSSKVLVIFDGCLFVPLFLASTFQSRIFILCETSEIEKSVQKELEQYEYTSCISTSTGDYQSMPFDFDFFDFVWSVNALVKKENILTILREIKNILTPQGRFLLLEEVLVNEARDNNDEYLYNAEDILNYGMSADLEQVSNITLEKESKAHYVRLENSPFFIGRLQKNAIQLLKNNAIGNITCWHFIQFQKRNS